MGGQGWRARLALASSRRRWNPRAAPRTRQPTRTPRDRGAVSNRAKLQPRPRRRPRRCVWPVAVLCLVPSRARARRSTRRTTTSSAGCSAGSSRTTSCPSSCAPRATSSGSNTRPRSRRRASSSGRRASDAPSDDAALVHSLDPSIHRRFFWHPRYPPSLRAPLASRRPFHRRRVFLARRPPPRPYL